MLVSQKVLDALKEIGLNLYERNLWVALLARGSATAGELSEIAKVPRSRTYDILQSLADKGFVVLQASKPIKYLAIEPEEALDRAEKKMQDQIQSIVKRIDEIKGSPISKELTDLFQKGLKLVAPEEITGALKGRDSYLQQLNSMFKEASKKISIVTNSEGLNELFEYHLDSLKSAKERGVEIKIASSVEKSNDAVKALSGIATVKSIDEKEIPMTGRFVVVDGKEMVFSLTDSKRVHSSQDLTLWSKSEHAAGEVFEPLFNLLWNHSKEIS